MNTVNIIANLTKDPEDFGNKGSKFSVAWNTSYTNNETGEITKEVHYFKVISYSRAVTKHLSKGSRIGIQGSLRQNRWEKDDQKMQEVVILAESIDFLDLKKKDNPNGDDHVDTL